MERATALSEAPRVRRVCVFTTSYPSAQAAFAGSFVADQVEHLRARGLEIDVVGPSAYQHFGLASGERPLAANLRRRAWAAPLALGSMTLALRRAARAADVVHAHWLAGAVPAALAGKPFVLTLHGTGTAGRFEDASLLPRLPWLVRRAAVVVGVTEQLAAAAGRTGARDARWIPNGVAVPAEVGEEADPPELLFVGRLAPEKGIRELAEATRGLELVVAGDGPLRGLVPAALGFVRREEVARLMARAAVFVLPSFREGLPLALLEAMAHGRAVVTTPVGGIPSLVEDGVTGLLVPPGDVGALRAALQRVLADRDLRRALGSAARERVRELCSWERVTDELVSTYEAARRTTMA